MFYEGCFATLYKQTISIKLERKKVAKLFCKSFAFSYLSYLSILSVRQGQNSFIKKMKTEWRKHEFLRVYVF